MTQCSKCNGDTEYRQGISKKNNKPWQGNKCLDPQCNNMDFIRAGGNQRFQGTPQAPYKAPAPPVAPKNGKEREASIGALAMVKAMGSAGGYRLDKAERLQMINDIHDSYEAFKARLLMLDAKEMGFKDEVPF